MKLNIFNLNSISMLSGIIFLLTPFITSAELHQNISTNAKQEITTNNIVENILRDSEKALEHVELNPDKALLHVKSALVSIHNLKNEMSPDTHAENRSPLIIDDNKQYWFVYPQVHKDIFENKSTYPTIHKKFNTGVLYRGDEFKKNDELTAYFDYAFAHASLKTAREALVANNMREAVSSLKWVFEAIYISPDFYVAEGDSKQMIDKIFNLKGNYPAYTSID